jgi:hypothetical protein
MDFLNRCLKKIIMIINKNQMFIDLLVGNYYIRKTKEMNIYRP